jgi:hypothetical protein
MQKARLRIISMMKIEAAAAQLIRRSTGFLQQTFPQHRA